jgi:hypothetical protein
MMSRAVPGTCHRALPAVTLRFTTPPSSVGLRSPRMARGTESLNTGKSRPRYNKTADLRQGGPRLLRSLSD